MFQLFYDLIYGVLFSNGDGYISIYSVNVLNNGGEDLGSYLSTLLAIICVIVVYICCCLVVLKIIKTVANVFRG